MFRILTRSWGVFFYGLLAVLLCGGYEVGACLSSPDEIKVPGSTFTAERITVGKSGKGIPAVFSITFGDTLLYFRKGKWWCWYHHQAKQCLTQMAKEGKKSIQIDKNGLKIGVLKKWDDKWGGWGQSGRLETSFRGVLIWVLDWNDGAKRLEVYSTSGGRKDPEKPFLRFTDDVDCSKVREVCIRRWDNQGCNICMVSADGGLACPRGTARKGCRQTDPSKANKCVERRYPCGPSLEVQAYKNNHTIDIGEYTIHHDLKGPAARNFGVDSSLGQQHTGVIHLGNNKKFSSNGCSVNVNYRN